MISANEDRDSCGLEKVSSDFTNEFNKSRVDLYF